MYKPGPRQAIASRLKQAREQAGYPSAEGFCQKNNLPLASYLAYEQGEVPIKNKQARQYCKYLAISLRWLIVGEA